LLVRISFVLLIINYYSLFVIASYSLIIIILLLMCIICDYVFFIAGY